MGQLRPDDYRNSVAVGIYVVVRDVKTNDWKLLLGASSRIYGGMYLSKGYAYRRAIHPSHRQMAFSAMGGRLEGEESILDAGVRELDEETGYHLGQVLGHKQLRSRLSRSPFVCIGTADRSISREFDPLTAYDCVVYFLHLDSREVPQLAQNCHRSAQLIRSQFSLDPQVSRQLEEKKRKIELESWRLESLQSIYAHLDRFLVPVFHCQHQWIPLMPRSARTLVAPATREVFSSLLQTPSSSSSPSF